MAGNSFQSPVASEPSFGTPHEMTTSYVPYSGAGLAANANPTITPTGIPAGTKAVWAIFSCLYTNTGTCRFLSGAAHDFAIVSAATNNYGNGAAMVPLASGNFAFYNNTAITGLTIKVVAYWI